MSPQPSGAELATALVEAFGRPDDIVALLDEDAEWWVTPSSPPELMASVSRGREVIRGNMERVFSLLYRGDSVEVVVHHAIGQENLGAVRITLNAEFATGGEYHNEYTVWVDTDGGRIVRVWEYVDAAHALAQMQAANVDVGSAG